MVLLPVISSFASLGNPLPAIVMVCPLSASVGFISKAISLLPLHVFTVTLFTTATPAVLDIYPNGALLSHGIITTVISLMLVPTNLPLRYSDTRYTTSERCIARGVKFNCPVLLLKLNAPDTTSSGLLPLKPAAYVSCDEPSN